MKRIAAAALTLVLSAPTAVYAAGIPVIDGANLTETVAMVKSMGEQLKTMQDQLDTVKKQYSTITNMYQEMTGVTDFAKMIPNSVEDLHGFFPTVKYDISDWFSGPLNKVSSALKSAKEMFSIEELTKGTTHSPSIELYKDRGEFVYTFLGLAKESYDNLADRRPQLESFVTAAASANTQAAKQDINSRISAEMLLMLNDIAMLQALQLTAMMEAESLDHNKAGLVAYRPTTATATSTDGTASDTTP